MVISRQMILIKPFQKTLQDNIFDLTQFVLNGKIDEARELIRDLRLQGEDEIKIDCDYVRAVSHVLASQHFSQSR